MLNYDPQQTLTEVVFRLRHSVAPLVLRRPAFWLLFGFHLAVWFLKEPISAEVDDDGRLNLSFVTISAVLAMSTFFQVFYANIVFKRYLNVFMAIRELFWRGWQFAEEMKMHCKAKDKHLLLLSTRYTIASMVLFLYRPNSSREQVPEDEWQRLLALGLLVPEEVCRLRPLIRQQASMVVLHWTARVMRLAAERCNLTSNMLRRLLSALAAIRLSQDSVKDKVRLVMPFPYFHLVSLVLMVKLVFLAYGVALMHSVFAPVGFFFAQLVFAGTMELQGRLTDPFSGSVVDFPLHQWLADFTAGVLEFVNSHTAMDEYQDSGIWLKLGKAGRGFPSIVCGEAQQRPRRADSLLSHGSRKQSKVQRSMSAWTDTDPEGSVVDDEDDDD